MSLSCDDLFVDFGCIIDLGAIHCEMHFQEKNCKQNFLGKNSTRQI